MRRQVVIILRGKEDIFFRYNHERGFRMAGEERHFLMISKRNG